MGDVARFRIEAMHLSARLRAGEGALAEAAAGGLQDTWPRSAQLSLHARVAGVRPNAWEHESLVQVWGPRWAVYVVPRDAVAAFTLGRMPRDDGARQAAERRADEVGRFLDGRGRRSRDVSAHLGTDVPGALRVTALTGRVHLRWDTTDTWVVPAEPPEVDTEQARVDLARRFAGWFGAVTASRFARWAGIDRADAEETWAALHPELVEIAIVRGRRWTLARDVDRWVDVGERDLGGRDGGGRDGGVRLLPQGDPFLYADRERIVRDPALRGAIWPAGSQGAVLANGEIRGTWSRQQGDVEVWLPEITDEVRAAIEAEAMSIGPAIGRSASVRLLLR